MRRTVAQMAAATALQRCRRPFEHVVGESLPAERTASCQLRNYPKNPPVTISKSVHTQTEHYPDRPQQQPGHHWCDIHPHSQPLPPPPQQQQLQNFRTPLEHDSGAGSLPHTASSLMRDLFDPRNTAPRLNSLSISSSGIGDEEEDEEQVEADDDFFPRTDSHNSHGRPISCRVCSRHRVVGDQGTRQAALPPWVPHYMREIVKVIQEEVSSVMQKEMQKALAAHEDLIRGTLAVETAATPATGPASRLPCADQGPPQSSSGASSSVPRVTVASPVKPNTPGLGSEAVPKTANNAPPPPPPPAEPTYTPEQEAPECPACGLKCEHRLHLEAHLEACLSSPH
nr:unnamed protein product [Spirometra erinaceieuropaei]